MAQRQQWVKKATNDESNSSEDDDEIENSMASVSIKTFSFAANDTGLLINSIAAELEGYDSLVSDYKNQDCYLIQPLADNVHLFSLFDGHDKDGEVISGHVQRKIPLLLAEKLPLREHCTPTEDIVEAALKKSFSEVHKSLPDNVIGGTTASVVLQWGTKLFVANAGDSVSLVAVCNKNSATIVYQTRLDRPDIPEERERIEKLGGKVSTCGRIMYQDDNRKWKPGIAMSRSIGDRDMVGVTSEPRVIVLDLDEIVTKHEDDDCYILVISATDGMIDCVAPVQLAKSMANAFSNENGTNPSDTTKDLVQQAADMWKLKTSGCYRDDITIVVSKLKLPLTKMGTE